MDGFDHELEAFAASEWGQAATRQVDAEGLCKRATLVLLARLQAAGLADGVELWRLEGATAGKGRGPAGYGNHWVLIRRGELIDVSARQFDPYGPHIRRVPPQDELGRWRHHERIDPDSDAMWGGPLRSRVIAPHWRDLATVGPPGDLADWPYPRHQLEPTSRFYATGS